jgi:hypothetical protein
MRYTSARTLHRFVAQQHTGTCHNKASILIHSWIFRAFIQPHGLPQKTYKYHFLLFQLNAYMSNTYIYHQQPTTCFGVCCTIFRENTGLLTQKTICFCNVATKCAIRPVFLIYNAVTMFKTICISYFCTLKLGILYI